MMDMDYVVSDVDLSDVDLSDGELENTEIETSREVARDDDSEQDYPDDESEREYLPVKSKNEKDDEKSFPPIKVSLGIGDLLVEAGDVLHTSMDTVIVRCAKIKNSGTILDAGSLLFSKDGALLARIYDTLGPVKEPFYAAIINPNGENLHESLAYGIKLYYTDRYANLVFEEAIKKQKKSSDASNEHDEEVNESDADFSDDQEEMLAKAAKKTRNKSRKKRNFGGLKREQPIGMQSIPGPYAFQTFPPSDGIHNIQPIVQNTYINGTSAPPTVNQYGTDMISSLVNMIKIINSANGSQCDPAFR